MYLIHLYWQEYICNPLTTGFSCLKACHHVLSFPFGISAFSNVCYFYFHSFFTVYFTVLRRALCVLGAKGNLWELFSIIRVSRLCCSLLLAVWCAAQLVRCVIVVNCRSSLNTVNNTLQNVRLIVIDSVGSVSSRCGRLRGFWPCEGPQVLLCRGGGRLLSVMKAAGAARGAGLWITYSFVYTEEQCVGVSSTMGTFGPLDYKKSLLNALLTLSLLYWIRLLTKFKSERTFIWESCQFCLLFWMSPQCHSQHISDY